MCLEAAPVRHPHRRRQRGFTLIEAMIVVAVIALLAAVAMPSFQDSIRKSRRTDARNALTTVAQLLERYNTQNNTYAGASLSGTGALYPNKSESGYYNLTLSNLAATTFTITATPPTGTGQAADSCGSFTLNQTGARTPAASGCW